MPPISIYNKLSNNISKRAELQTYLGSNPFSDTTALNAYNNTELKVGDSTTIVGDGRYEVASLGPVVWTRTGDDSVNLANTAATYTLDEALTPLSTVQTIGRTSPITGTAVGNAPFVHGKAITTTGWLESLTLFGMNSGGAGFIEVWSRSGSTMTRLAQYPVTIPAGAATLTMDDFGLIPLEAGQYLGVYAYATNGKLAFTVATSDDGGVFYPAGSPGNTDTFTQASPATTVRFEWGWTVKAVTVSETRLATAEADIVDIQDQLNTTEIAFVGRNHVAPPAVTASKLGYGCFVFADPIPNNQPVARFYYATTGAMPGFKLQIRSKSGNDFTLEEELSVDLSSGSGVIDLPDGWGAGNAGNYAGFYVQQVSSQSVCFTSGVVDGLGWYWNSPSTSNDTTFTDASAQTSLRLEAGFEWDTVTPIDLTAIATEADPLSVWASTHGPETDPTVAASLPTITVGASNAISVITGAANASVSIAATSSRISLVRGAWATQSDASYQAPLRGGASVRFKFTGRRFEVRCRTNSTYQGTPTIKIDGQYVTGINQVGMNPDGNHLWLVDYGADTETYQAISLTIAAGGTGHAVGDIITTTAGTIRVTRVSAGAITSAMIVTRNSLSSVPANPLAQSATTGSGTGATFTMNYTRRHTTITPRTVEIVMGEGCWFGGINVDTTATVTPWPERNTQPKLCIAGDSITRGAWSDYADSTWANVCARRLGLSERFVKLGTDGMGWARSGNAFTSILSSVVATGADVVVVALGVNDQGTSTATSAVTAAVSSGLATMQAAMPTTKFVVLTGFDLDGSGNTATYATAVLDGVAAAPDQDRVRGIDITGTYRIYIDDSTGEFGRTTPDDLHPGQPGHQSIGESIAPLVEAAILEMIAV